MEASYSILAVYMYGQIQSVCDKQSPLGLWEGFTGLPGGGIGLA